MGIRTRGWAEPGQESRSLKSAELACRSQCLVSVTLSERLGTKKTADSAEEVCFGIKFADRCLSSKLPRGAMATEELGKKINLPFASSKFLFPFYQLGVGCLSRREAFLRK